MSVWAWIAIGAAALIGVPLVVGLAVARILGGIAEDALRAVDQELWSSAPVTREIEATEDDLSARRARRRFQRSRG
jgi:hypothetical protein